MDSYNNTAVMVVTTMEMTISLQHGQLQQHSSDGNDYHEGDEVTTWTTTATTEISELPELKPLTCFQT